MNVTFGENPVTGTSTTLSVVGADDGGTDNLSYEWSFVSGPGDAWLDDAESAGTTVDFTKAGTYYFSVTITDACGSSISSSPFQVQVAQTLSTIEASPDRTAVLPDHTVQLAATGLDQFDDDMATQPTFTWSIDSGGVGTLSSTTGLYNVYTAPSRGDSVTSTITVSAGDESGTAKVAVKGNIGTDIGYTYSQVQTPLQCVHGCDDTFDLSGDITITFARSAIVESLVVSGQLISTACHETEDGKYYVGTLDLFKEGGGIEFVKVELDGDVEPGENQCMTAYPGGDDNIGTYSVVVFSGEVPLLKYGKLTQIVLTDIQRVEFRKRHYRGQRHQCPQSLLL